MPEKKMKTWLYGLTADEWFEVACLDEKSEVAPCCGNIGLLRDLLRELMWFQGEHEDHWQKLLGSQVLESYESLGDEHGLSDRARYPLLNKVLDGIRKQATEGRS